MKIMIVDDNAPMRETIKSVLARKSTKFIQCNNGIEAIDEYKKSHPDWVLMDIRMKEMDGLRAAEAIKNIDSEAKIVIVTNYDDPDFRAEAKRLGTMGYVLKENLTELRNIIQLN